MLVIRTLTLAEVYKLYLVNMRPIPSIIFDRLHKVIRYACRKGFAVLSGNLAYLRGA